MHAWKGLVAVLFIGITVPCAAHEFQAVDDVHAHPFASKAILRAARWTHKSAGFPIFPPCSDND